MCCPFAAYACHAYATPARIFCQLVPFVDMASRGIVSYLCMDVVVAATASAGQQGIGPELYAVHSCCQLVAVQLNCWRGRKALEQCPGYIRPVGQRMVADTLV